MNHTIVDTLSVTFPLSYFKEFCNSGKMEEARRVFGGDPYYLRKNIDESFTVEDMKNQFSVDLMADFVGEWFYDFLGVNVVIEQRWTSGRNYFKYGFRFDGGFLAWGGNNKVFNQFGETEFRPERVQIYFDATGCEKYINDQSCERLRSALLAHDGRISRCDLALDLMNGQRTVDDVENAYYDGLFSGNGRPPKCVRVEEKTRTKKGLPCRTAGDTLYVGSRQGGKYFRAYEKGKQLGDQDSKWLRLEVEYNTNNKRVISPDVLVKRDLAFAEAYTFCSMAVSILPASAAVDRLVQVVRVKSDIALDALSRHCQRSYGTLIHYLKSCRRVIKGRVVYGFSDSEIVDRLARVGRPARLA